MAPSSENGQPGGSLGPPPSTESTLRVCIASGGVSSFEYVTGVLSRPEAALALWEKIVAGNPAAAVHLRGVRTEVRGRIAPWVA